MMVSSWQLDQFTSHYVVIDVVIVVVVFVVFLVFGSTQGLLNQRFWIANTQAEKHRLIEWMMSRPSLGQGMTCKNNTKAATPHNPKHKSRQHTSKRRGTTQHDNSKYKGNNNQPNIKPCTQTQQ
jgi:hypothetical protein